MAWYVINGEMLDRLAPTATGRLAPIVNGFLETHDRVPNSNLYIATQEEAAELIPLLVAQYINRVDSVEDI